MQSRCKYGLKAEVIYDRDLKELDLLRQFVLDARFCLAVTKGSVPVSSKNI